MQTSTPIMLEGWQSQSSGLSKEHSLRLSSSGLDTINAVAVDAADELKWVGDFDETGNTKGCGGLVPALAKILALKTCNHLIQLNHAFIAAPHSQFSQFLSSRCPARLWAHSKSEHPPEASFRTHNCRLAHRNKDRFRFDRARAGSWRLQAKAGKPLQKT
jgi:hypothetical protein